VSELIIRNVHQALPEALYRLAAGHGMVTRDTRNGKVLMADGPMLTCYMKPTERVVFWEERDANPFFHLMESLWMLGGRNDVEWISRYNSQFSQFSDDGSTFHGAYGHRWTEHFRATGSLQSWSGRIGDDNRKDGILDQLKTIAELLTHDPNDRRCVLTMWDPTVDLGMQGRDFPCNTHAYFGVSACGCLDMTVCNRSNDVVWGCYGANAVHFSMLQEYLALCIGIPVGRYFQFSNNWHLYLENHEALMDALSPYAVMPPSARTCPYTRGQVEPFPLMSKGVEVWTEDLFMFLEEGEQATGYRDPFFRKVAMPMARAWSAFKSSSSPDACRDAVKILQHDCHATDWAVAAISWLEKRADWRLK